MHGHCRFSRNGGGLSVTTYLAGTFIDLEGGNES